MTALHPSPALFIYFLPLPLSALRTHARTLPCPRHATRPRRVRNAAARVASRNTRATHISAGALAWASRRDALHPRTRRASVHGESVHGRTRARPHPVLRFVCATRAVVRLETHPQRSTQAGVAPADLRCAGREYARARARRRVAIGGSGNRDVDGNVSRARVYISARHPPGLLVRRGGDSERRAERRESTHGKTRAFCTRDAAHGLGRSREKDT
ncbi:hypothetical protein IEO21_08217 [Rhodonia placenta]|uniref:Secreted protein n=1 Tax=Rhodonia placenta TaxID=104341 RepID=A0A8H7TZM4_9APHY|nr:hypothetical protein IEO21_08217 [Postia placenta]